MAGFAPAPPIGPGAFSGLSARTASILCYVPAIGWIAAVIVLASQKFKANHVVRFHAFQGLYLFICGLFVNWVVRPMVHGLSDQFMRLDHILETLILGVSIFMIVKASREEAYVLPIIGELAQRSATEH
jgi:uncharacterized membrane protein